MFRSSLGLLSPIKEERLKEGAAEEDYDEEEEASTVEEGDDDRSAEEEDDEEQLLSADALRGRMRAAAANGRFQMLPLEMEEAGHGGDKRAASSLSYLIVRTEEPPLAPAEGLETPQRSRPSSSTTGGEGSGSSSSASRMVGEILASPRGGFECPFPPPFDEEHPDPCECLCNLVRMPRVPAARNHYLIYRSRSSGRIYTVGPHWAGLVFTVVLVGVASSLFIRNVCVPLGLGYVAAAGAWTVLTLLTLLRTACLDPGFVTRSVPESQFPRRRYCSVCRIYTAPDAAHCDDCKVCVDRCDHHCPWTGHCIGRGNMGAFIAFNCSWILYVVFVLCCLAIQNGLFGGGGAVGGGAAPAPVAPGHAVSG